MNNKNISKRNFNKLNKYLVNNFNIIHNIMNNNSKKSKINKINNKHNLLNKLKI